MPSFAMAINSMIKSLLSILSTASWANHLHGQGVIQEFAIEAIKHQLAISNRAEGFGGLSGAQSALKWTVKPTIFTISDNLLDI